MAKRKEEQKGQRAQKGAQLECSSCKTSEGLVYTLDNGIVVMACKKCEVLIDMPCSAKAISKSSFDLVVDRIESEAKRLTKDSLMSGDFAHCRLQTFSVQENQLPMSIFVLMNAVVGSESKVMAEVGELYISVKPSKAAEYSFLNSVISDANSRVAVPIFSVRKAKTTRAKYISLTPYGVLCYNRMLSRVGELPRTGFLQKLAGVLSKKHSVSINGLFLIDAVGAGTTYSELAKKYGIISDNPKDFGVMSSVVSYINKVKAKAGEKPVFFVERLTEEQMKERGYVGTYHRKPSWVVLTEYGREIYDDIQKAKR